MIVSWMGLSKRNAVIVARQAFILLVASISLSAARGEIKNVSAPAAHPAGSAEHWKAELDRHRKAGRVSEQIEAAARLAGALQKIGQHAAAVETLDAALETAEGSGQSELIIAAKNRLGSALMMVRQFERAEELLRESLASASETNAPKWIAANLNDLGSLLAMQRKFEASKESFEKSAAIARETNDHALLAGALGNLAAMAAAAGWHDKADEYCSQLAAQLENLEPEAKAFLLLAICETDIKIAPFLPEPARKRVLLRAFQSAQSARPIAEKLEDGALLSNAFGLLGRLYELDQQSEHALSMTRKAVFKAQQAQNPNALVRWEWQAGRLLKLAGQQPQAIAAYRRAVQTFDSVRHDVALGHGNSADQASFREAIGSLFYELADLLLTEASSARDATEAQSLLGSARDTVEQLKAVELENYFQDDCVNVARTKTASVESVDPQSAVLYLIPLPGRTEILLSVQSEMHRFTAAVGSEELLKEVRAFRRNLETRTSYGYLVQGQRLYDLLIRPVRPLLLEKGVTTLVFIPDGALQTIPLASLHDGKRFLMEEFAVAVSPGLSLVEPRALERRKPAVLLSGLSDAVQGFPSLDFVKDELQTIETEFAGGKLMNQQFVTAAVERMLTEEQFSIVHIASHGEFNKDARKTFVLTYDGKLTLNKLESLIRPSQYRGRPVELLVLSACQTAAGDDRAALGLAGVAVKAGARSAVASLWFVNDQSTSAFVSELYRQLRQNPELSRAKAVQAAQVQMLKDRRFRHPCYWAPYLLIGNWL